MVDYNKILSNARIRASESLGRTLLTESESDRGRVLFSPAFRRLQQKAQVFSMEPNAAVRSRLTHSLEVSQLGRYLADLICQKINQKQKNCLDNQKMGAFINFVEVACLMHDIGNPPFGHFGEAAIQEWFTENGEACLQASLKKTPVDDESKNSLKAEDLVVLQDFKQFDGNPQGLRVVCRLQWNRDPHGLNLTKTSIATFLKYIRGPSEPAEPGMFRKKPGFFTSEKELIDQVWGEFGYATPQRFPLAYIMEAADDIAYCISDLEDAFEKNIISKNNAFKEITKRYTDKDFDDKAPCHGEIVAALQGISTEKGSGEFTYTDFRTKVNTAIVSYVAEKYVNEERLVEKGELETLLPESEPPGAFLKILKDYCKKNVYPAIAVQRIELAGFNAIFGLLEQFKPVLCATREQIADCLADRKQASKGRRILLLPKLFKMFPPNYVEVYKHHVVNLDSDESSLLKEWNYRAHLLVDYISGMTDDFAMTTYRNFSGLDL